MKKTILAPAVALSVGLTGALGLAAAPAFADSQSAQQAKFSISAEKLTSKQYKDEGVRVRVDGAKPGTRYFTKHYKPGNSPDQKSSYRGGYNTVEGEGVQNLLYSTAGSGKAEDVGTHTFVVLLAYDGVNYKDDEVLAKFEVEVTSEGLEEDPKPDEGTTPPGNGGDNEKPTPTPENPEPDLGEGDEIPEKPEDGTDPAPNKPGDGEGEGNDQQPGEGEGDKNPEQPGNGDDKAKPEQPGDSDKDKAKVTDPAMKLSDKKVKSKDFVNKKKGVTATVTGLKPGTTVKFTVTGVSGNAKKVRTLESTITADKDGNATLNIAGTSKSNPSAYIGKYNVTAKVDGKELKDSFEVVNGGKKDKSDNKSDEQPGSGGGSVSGGASDNVSNSTTSDTLPRTGQGLGGLAAGAALLTIGGVTVLLTRRTRKA